MNFFFSRQDTILDRIKKSPDNSAISLGALKNEKELQKLIKLIDEIYYSFVPESGKEKASNLPKITETILEENFLEPLLTNIESFETETKKTNLFDPKFNFSFRRLYS